jgi:hypothetical protein
MTLDRLLDQAYPHWVAEQPLPKQLRDGIADIPRRDLEAKARDLESIPRERCHISWIQRLILLDILST